jgi:hypothetical protein
MMTMIHRNGRAERLTLLTMYALSQKGVNFDLTICIQPKMTKLENAAYGSKIGSIVRKAEKVNILKFLEGLFIDRMIYF